MFRPPAKLRLVLSMDFCTLPKGANSLKLAPTIRSKTPVLLLISNNVNSKERYPFADVAALNHTVTPLETVKKLTMVLDAHPLTLLFHLTEEALSAQETQ